MMAKPDRETVAAVVREFDPPIISVNGAAAHPDLLWPLCNDDGNSRRLLAMYGDDLRYCYAFRKWLAWDGRRWMVDTIGEAKRMAKNAMMEFFRQAADAKNADLERFARQSLDQ